MLKLLLYTALTNTSKILHSMCRVESSESSESSQKDTYVVRAAWWDVRRATWKSLDRSIDRLDKKNRYGTDAVMMGTNFWLHIYERRREKQPPQYLLYHQ